MFKLTELIRSETNFENYKELLRKKLINKSNSMFRSSKFSVNKKEKQVKLVKRDEETHTSSSEQVSHNTTTATATATATATTSTGGTTTKKSQSFQSDPEFIKFTVIVTVCLSVLFAILFLIIHCCNKDLLIEIIDKIKQFFKKVQKK
jgi:hypothetical protein